MTMAMGQARFSGRCDVALSVYGRAVPTCNHTPKPYCVRTDFAIEKGGEAEYNHVKLMTAFLHKRPL